MRRDQARDVATVAALAAALGAGAVPTGFRFRAECRLCGRPILPGEGYRQTPEGRVHGKCAMETEAKKAHG